MRRGNIGRIGDTDSLQDWFTNLPFITKVFLVSTLLGGFTITFNIISPAQFVIDWYLIRNKFHIWRLFTSFIFAGPFSFNFLMHTYVLYQNSLRYETSPFNTGSLYLYI